LAFAQFENEDDYTTPLKVMLARVLPILDSLQAEGADTESMNFAGSIKDRWVNLLADEENIEGWLEGLLFQVLILLIPFQNS